MRASPFMLPRRSPSRHARSAAPRPPAPSKRPSLPCAQRSSCCAGCVRQGQGRGDTAPPPTAAAAAPLTPQCSHPNIIAYLGDSEDAGSLYIFLEHASGGSLRSLIKQFGALDEAVLRRFAWDILCGLAYLHGRGILHR